MNESARLSLFSCPTRPVPRHPTGDCARGVRQVFRPGDERHRGDDAGHSGGTAGLSWTKAMTFFFVPAGVMFHTKSRYEYTHILFVRASLYSLVVDFLFLFCSVCVFFILAVVRSVPLSPPHVRVYICMHALFGRQHR